MNQEMPTGGARPASGDREEIAAGIEQTRQELAETVEALAAKVDVPARVRDKSAQVREQLTGTLQTARAKAPQVAASIGDAVPDPALRTVRRPAVLYAMAGAFTAAGLWLWKKGGRS